jgi:hypothetical protein
MTLELTVRVIEALELALPSPAPIAVRVSLGPFKAADAQATAVADPAHPVWDQTFRFISEKPKREGLIVELFAERGDDFVRAGKRAAIFARDIPPDRPPAPAVVPIKSRGSLIARISCTVQARAIAPFSWGSYGSDYMVTSSYSDPGLQLSDPRPDEPSYPFDPEKVGNNRVYTRQILSGTLVGAAGLPRCDSYATIEIRGRGAPETSAQVVQSRNPGYNLSFNFGEVQRWEIVEIAIWSFASATGHMKLALVTVPVKEIELDSDEPMDIQLVAPASGMLMDVRKALIRVVFALRAEPL